MRQLPTPSVEQLLGAKPGTAIVGACPVGDALTGTALVAATSDGKLHCLWPSSGRATDTVSCPVPKHIFKRGFSGECAIMKLHALQLVPTLHSLWSRMQPVDAEVEESDAEIHNSMTVDVAWQACSGHSFCKDIMLHVCRRRVTAL